MLQNIFPSSFITWYSSHAKLVFHDGLLLLFSSFRFHTSCFSPVRFHWSSPFCLGSTTSRCSGNEPTLIPKVSSRGGKPHPRERRKSSLLFALQQFIVRQKSLLATWVGRGLGSTFTCRRWVWVPVKFTIDTRDQ